MLEFREIIGHQHEQLWNDYVFNHPESHFFHSIEWKNLLEREYDFTGKYYLGYEESSQRYVSAIPLFLINNLSGKKLISLPYSMYGGVLANNEVNFIKTLGHIETLAKQIEASRVHIWSDKLVRSSRLSTNASETDYYIDIEGKFENYFSGFKNATRRKIKQAENSNLTVAPSNDDTYLKDLYSLLINTRKRQGLPTPRESYLRQMISTFNTTTWLAKLHNEPVAFAFILKDNKNNWYNVYNATNHKGRSTNAMLLVHNVMIQNAFENNIARIYLGGAQTASLQQYKDQFHGVKRKVYFLGEKTNSSTSSLGLPFINMIPDLLYKKLSYLYLKQLY